MDNLVLTLVLALGISLIVTLFLLYSNRQLKLERYYWKNTIESKEDKIRNQEDLIHRAGKALEVYVSLLVSLPLVKINDSYRVSYDIKNRERSTVRVRYTDKDGKKHRDVVNAEIGYGSEEKWVSLEELKSLVLETGEESSDRFLILKCYNTIR